MITRTVKTPRLRKLHLRWFMRLVAKFKREGTVSSENQTFEKLIEDRAEEEGLK